MRGHSSDEGLVAFVAVKNGLAHPRAATFFVMVATSRAFECTFYGRGVKKNEHAGFRHPIFGLELPPAKRTIQEFCILRFFRVCVVSEQNVAICHRRGDVFSGSSTKLSKVLDKSASGEALCCSAPKLSFLTRSCSSFLFFKPPSSPNWQPRLYSCRTGTAPIF
mmetsp:Transcript_22064/g.48227  ORF Transcript_22064/g.48227 Transcript_22064/m.48227 type:complete len:164 (-) Transcript_22064:75-566(-)